MRSPHIEIRDGDERGDDEWSIDGWLKQEQNRLDLKEKAQHADEFEPHDRKQHGERAVPTPCLDRPQLVECEVVSTRHERQPAEDTTCEESFEDRTPYDVSHTLIPGQRRESGDPHARRELAVDGEQANLRLTVQRVYWFDLPFVPRKKLGDKKV